MIILCDKITSEVRGQYEDIGHASRYMKIPWILIFLNLKKLYNFEHFYFKRIDYV